MTDGQMMDGSVQLDPGGCSLSQVSTLELCLGDVSLGTGVALQGQWARLPKKKIELGR